MWRVQTLALIAVSVAAASVFVTGEPATAVYGVLAAAIFRLGGRWIPGLAGVMIRRMILTAPTEATARIWHVGNDENADFREERIWSDVRHRWEYRFVSFSESDEAAREAEGRISHDARQW